MFRLLLDMGIARSTGVFLNSPGHDAIHEFFRSTSGGSGAIVSRAVSGYHLAMRDESLLIPFAVERLESSPILILAPHPDDEIFGCAALLVEGIRAGAEISTIILTGGGAQGDPVERIEESREAARRLGAPEPVFRDFSDRGLDPGDGRLLLQIETEIRRLRPALLAVPSPAEIHPDHRALALAVWKVLRKILRGETGCLPSDFKLLSCEISAPLRPNLLVDLSEDWERVLDAARAFSSQNVLRPYLDVFESMARIRCLSLPDSVSRAAGFFGVDRSFILEKTVREWAAVQGPSAGLEDDDPALARRKSQGRFLSRFLSKGGFDD